MSERVLYTAIEAQRELGIKASTVRSWAHRGKLFCYGRDEFGRPCYDQTDLVRLQRFSRRYGAT